MLLIVLIIITLATTTLSSVIKETNSMQEQSQQYCQFESFHPQCSKNEVILMESAIYGRMKIGKCITAQEIQGFEDDPRFLGCSADVLSLMDEQCSGKAECQVRVSDMSDEKRHNCFSGLRMYLETSYKCISVADEKRSCAVAASVTPIHVDLGILQSSCGTMHKPWTIEALVGQKLTISLLDLTPTESHKVNGNQCLQFGVLVDRSAKRNISICKGGSQREKQLYTSSGNAVELFLSHQSDSKENTRNFPIFMKFKAVGCSDIVPSEDTWLKRKDDLIVIGCYSSRQTWKLNCNEGKWTGVIGNCTQDLSRTEFLSEDIDKTELSHTAQALAIASICGFTLAICFIIMCIGALCLRRFYIQNKANSKYRTLNYESEFGRSNEMTGQRISSAFPTQCPGDIVKGLLAQQAPTYSVYSGQDGVDNTHNHLDQLRVINS